MNDFGIQGVAHYKIMERYGDCDTFSNTYYAYRHDPAWGKNLCNDKFQGMPALVIWVLPRDGVQLANLLPSSWNNSAGMPGFVEVPTKSDLFTETLMIASTKLVHIYKMLLEWISVGHQHASKSFYPFAVTKNMDAYRCWRSKVSVMNNLG